MTELDFMIIGFGDAYRALRIYHKDPPATLYAAIKQLLFLESDKIDSSEIITILERIINEDD